MQTTNGNSYYDCIIIGIGQTGRHCVEALQANGKHPLFLDLGSAASVTLFHQFAKPPEELHQIKQQPLYPFNLGNNHIEVTGRPQWASYQGRDTLVYSMEVSHAELVAPQPAASPPAPTLVPRSRHAGKRKSWKLRTLPATVLETPFPSPNQDRRSPAPDPSASAPSTPFPPLAAMAAEHKIAPPTGNGLASLRKSKQHHTQRTQRQLRMNSGSRSLAEISAPYLSSTSASLYPTEPPAAAQWEQPAATIERAVVPEKPGLKKENIHLKSVHEIDYGEESGAAADPRNLSTQQRRAIAERELSNLINNLG